MCLKNLAGTISAIISTVLSILVVFLALLYLLYAVNIAGESVTKQKKLCETYPFSELDIVKAWCANWKTETAAGALGLIFGFLQAAVSIAMLCSQKEMWRTWLAVQILALIPMLAITGIVFKIYRDYEDKNFIETILQLLAKFGVSGYKADFNHNGAPSDAKTGNDIVLTYGCLALLDAGFIVVGSVVILFCEVLI